MGINKKPKLLNLQQKHTRTQKCKHKNNLTSTPTTSLRTTSENSRDSTNSTRQNALSTMITLLLTMKVSTLEPDTQIHGNVLNLLSNSVTNLELAKMRKSSTWPAEPDLLAKLLEKKDSEISTAAISARRCSK